MAHINDSLHSAVERGDVEIVALFLSQGVSVNVLKKCRTPLHLACRKGHATIVSLLLNNGADVNMKTTNIFCETALHIAAQGGWEEIVELLLSKDADVSATNGGGSTALDEACDKGNSVIAELLLNHGADIEFQFKCKQSALYYAAYSGHEKTVEVLLRRGAITNGVNHVFDTPLHVAALHNFPKIVEMLVRNGADVNVTSHCNKYMPLHLAAHQVTGEIAQILLNGGAKVNAMSEDGQTPLHFACKSGSLHTVNVLLTHGAQVNFKSAKRAPLHEASTTNIVELLLDYKADVNATDEKGETPLVSFENAPAHRNNRFDSAVKGVIVKHLLKMRAQNIFVSESNLLCIRENEELHQVSQVCEGEIEKMRRTMIGDNRVNFFDVLTKSENKLADLMSNEGVVKVLQSGDHKETFPVYASLIDRQFKKGCERRDLLLESTEWVHSVLNKVLTFPYICAEKINHFLPNSDLVNMIKAKLESVDAPD